MALSYAHGQWKIVENIIDEKDWKKDKYDALAQLAFVIYQTFNYRLGTVQVFTHVRKDAFPFDFCCVFSFGPKNYAVWIPDFPSLLQLMKEIDAHLQEATLKPSAILSGTSSDITDVLLQTNKLLQKIMNEGLPVKIQNFSETENSARSTTPEIPDMSSPTSSTSPFITVVSRKGTVYAVSLTNGTLLWKFPISHSIDTIIAQDHIVYVNSHVDPLLDQKQAIHLYALQASDGSLLWHTTLEEEEMADAMAIDRHILFISSRDQGHVYALNAHSGATFWTAPLSPDGKIRKQYRLITAMNGIVYLLDRNFSGIEAFLSRNGTPLWTFTGVHHPEQIIVTEKLLYILEYISNAPLNQPWITLVNAQDGTLLEKQRLEQQEHVLIITEQDIVYTTKEGNAQLCAVRLADGAELWCSQLDISTREFAIVSPVVMGDLLAYFQLVHSPDQLILQVKALHANDGTPRWQWQTLVPGNSAINAFHLVGMHGTLYLSTSQGLYALHGSDGHLLWHVLNDTDLSFLRPSG